MDRKRFNFRIHIGERPFERLLLYVVLAITIVMASVSYVILGNSHATRTASANAARAQSLKADIAALPTVASIQPGKTSGLLDYVITTRQDLAKHLDTKQYAPQNVTGIFALRPKSQTNNARTDAYARVLNKQKILLNQTAADLTALKKVVEYQPLADLADRIDVTNGTPERLQRTQTGLKAAATYLSQSLLVDKTQLITQLRPLIAQSVLVTDETKQQWSKDMLAFQTNLLQGIASEDIQSTDYSQILDGITVSYQ